eukprot:CAMPEP_0113995820 /NCGR_PEP_ID=MMETSP0328-20130328/11428_1 /TAXON_ID=39455 /ORGANISM="Alexandrium minutum" /LENGTH=34 /assembly_acc=CAM_ASM_000350
MRVLGARARHAVRRGASCTLRSPTQEPPQAARTN